MDESFECVGETRALVFEEGILRLKVPDERRELPYELRSLSRDSEHLDLSYSRTDAQKSLKPPFSNAATNSSSVEAV